MYFSYRFGLFTCRRYSLPTAIPIYLRLNRVRSSRARQCTAVRHTIKFLSTKSESEQLFPCVQRYLCCIQYDGTNFSGWQFQPNQRTVEGVIRDIFDKFIGRGNFTSITGSARTDAGVHALHSTFHIDICRKQRRSGTAMPPLEPAKLVDAFNSVSSRLSGDVSMLSASYVPYGFSARFDTVRKTYLYRILFPLPANISTNGSNTKRSIFPVMQQNRTWCLNRTLDVKAMQSAASKLIGYHDFSSFRAAGCNAKSPNRLLESLDIHVKYPQDGAAACSDIDRLRSDTYNTSVDQHTSILMQKTAHHGSSEDIIQMVDQTYNRYGQLDIIARGPSFLYNMVRNLVGYLVYIGQGRSEPSITQDVLLARNRSMLQYMTAPACGLYLCYVEYPPLSRLIAQINQDKSDLCGAFTCDRNTTEISEIPCTCHKYDHNRAHENTADTHMSVLSQTETTNHANFSSIRQSFTKVYGNERDINAAGNPWYQPHRQHTCCIMLHKARRIREMYRRQTLEHSSGSTVENLDGDVTSSLKETEMVGKSPQTNSTITGQDRYQTASYILDQTLFCKDKAHRADLFLDCTLPR